MQGIIRQDVQLVERLPPFHNLCRRKYRHVCTHFCRSPGESVNFTGIFISGFLRVHTNGFFAV